MLLRDLVKFFNLRADSRLFLFYLFLISHHVVDLPTHFFYFQSYTISPLLYLLDEVLSFGALSLYFLQFLCLLIQLLLMGLNFCFYLLAFGYLLFFILFKDLKQLVILHKDLLQSKMLIKHHFLPQHHPSCLLHCCFLQFIEHFFLYVKRSPNFFFCYGLRNEFLLCLINDFLVLI